jgi:hypothetical protein
MYSIHTHINHNIHLVIFTNIYPAEKWNIFSHVYPLWPVVYFQHIYFELLQKWELHNNFLAPVFVLFNPKFKIYPDTVTGFIVTPNHPDATNLSDSEQISILITVQFTCPAIVHNVTGGILAKPTFIISPSSRATPSSSPRFLRRCIFVTTLNNLLVSYRQLILIWYLTNKTPTWVWWSNTSRTHDLIFAHTGHQSLPYWLVPNADHMQTMTMGFACFFTLPEGCSLTACLLHGSAILDNLW